MLLIVSSIVVVTNEECMMGGTSNMQEKGDKYICIDSREIRRDEIGWVTMNTYEDNIKVLVKMRRFQWPLGLCRGSAAVLLLRLRVRIPPGAWMSLLCECCVFDS